MQPSPPRAQIRGMMHTTCFFRNFKEVIIWFRTQKSRPRSHYGNTSFPMSNKEEGGGGGGGSLFASEATYIQYICPTSPSYIIVISAAQLPSR